MMKTLTFILIGLVCGFVSVTPLAGEEVKLIGVDQGATKQPHVRRYYRRLHHSRGPNIGAQHEGQLRDNFHMGCEKLETDSGTSPR